MTRDEGGALLKISITDGGRLLNIEDASLALKDREGGSDFTLRLEATMRRSEGE